MWFFGKREKKAESVDSIREQAWTMYAVLLENNLVVVRLLQNAVDGRTDLTFQVGVATPLNKPNTKGFHDAEEGAELGVIEDAISAAFEKDCKSAFVLSNCSKGVKEWVFYTRDPEFVKAEFLKIRDATTTHKLQLMIKSDPDWSTYNAFVQLGQK
jgi:hypothetical protein